MENRRRERQPNRRPQKRREQPAKEKVIYTPGRPFFRRHLLIQLLTVAAVVLAFTVSISIFFKVDTVLVTGASKYSAWTVAEASGVEKGDSLLFFGRAGAASRIKEKLPYVDRVRFEIKLPGTVNIILEEKQVAYGIQADSGSWWLITADGIVAEQVTQQDAQSHGVLEGVLITEPKIGSKAVAYEEGGESGTTKAQDHLEAALVVLYQLERYELFANIQKVDVSDIFALRIYYGDRYRIELGDTGSMSDKIGAIKTTIAKLGVTDSGVLKLLYIDEKWRVLHQSWAQE